MAVAARTKQTEDPGLAAKRSAKKAEHDARQAKRDAISGKKFSELTNPEKDKLLQLLGEQLGLIVEE